VAKLLAVFDTDVLYASRLMEYLRKSDRCDFEVLLFTRMDILIDFLKHQTVEILLLGGEKLADDFPDGNIGHVFILCDDKRLMREREEAIFKYQAADRVCSEILSRYTKLEDGRYSNCNGKVRFVAYFSPIPGGDKISHAWAQAKKMSESSKTLFINLEMLPASGFLKQEDESRSMSELLYYLKEGKPEYINRLKDCLEYSEKMAFLRKPVHGFDLLSLNREDMKRFMEDIENLADYEIVVFYLGMYSEASMEVLKHCDEINVIISDISYEEDVYEEWRRQMSLIGMDMEKNKLNRVKLQRGW